MWAILRNSLTLRMRQYKLVSVMVKCIITLIRQQVWPENNIPFQTAMKELYTVMHEVAMTILESMARVLKLKASYIVFKGVTYKSLHACIKNFRIHSSLSRFIKMLGIWRKIAHKYAFTIILLFRLEE